MSIDRLFRWASFCAGIITAIFSGYMFYINDKVDGAICLAVCVGFLSFSTRFQAVKSPSQTNSSDDSDLHALAVLVSDLAVMSLQNIGRTVPPGSKEIADIEEKLNTFLDAMPMTPDERDEIAGKFESLRDRTRRNQGGRAIMRSSRL